MLHHQYSFFGSDPADTDTWFRCIPMANINMITIFECQNFPFLKTSTQTEKKNVCLPLKADTKFSAKRSKEAMLSEMEGHMWVWQPVRAKISTADFTFSCFSWETWHKVEVFWGESICDMEHVLSDVKSYFLISFYISSQTFWAYKYTFETNTCCFHLFCWHRVVKVLGCCH